MSPSSLSWPHLTTAAVLLFVHLMCLLILLPGDMTTLCHSLALPLSLSCFVSLSLSSPLSTSPLTPSIPGTGDLMNSSVTMNDLALHQHLFFECVCMCVWGSSGLIQQASNFLFFLQHSHLGFICGRIELTMRLIRRGSLNSPSACFSVYNLTCESTKDIYSCHIACNISRRANLARTNSPFMT